MSVFLYTLMILVWGFSWIAIKWQHGDVAMEVSIFYRFAIAASLMFIFGHLFNKIQKVSARHHLYFALQGTCLFCFNFIAFYSSTIYIASGLTAVVMASTPIFNAIHGKLIYKTEPSANFWFGTALGLAGITLLFTADFMATVWSTDVLIGLLYALAGTWCFSIGNMVSIRNTRNKIKPYTATSYAMVYGCIALLLIILVKGHRFEIDLNLRYFGGLMYLAIPASIIGFTVYLVLVDRMGASNAAYLLVITPIVALTVSSFYESYQWTSYSVIGLLLVIAGNICISRKTPLFGIFINKRIKNQT